MAQPLDGRIAAALKPGARLADCEAVLADAEAERLRVQAHRADAAERRANPSLSADEAAEAQLEVQEDELRLIRLDRAVEKLGEAVTAKKAQAKAAKALERYKQVESRRDKLAEELQSKVAPAIALIAEYCQRIVDSDAEAEEVGRNLPGGCKPLKSAEQLARGYAGHTWGASMEVVQRLTDIRLPHFDRGGSAWPDLEGDARRQEETVRRSRELTRKANAEREASKKRCYVTRPAERQGQVLLAHADGRVPLYGVPFDCWLYPEQADLAERQGLVVEPWSEERAKAIEEAARERADA